MECTGIAINAILVCEKVTPLNEALPYFFAPVWAAFKYDQPDNSSSSFPCALLRLPFPTAGVVQPLGLSRGNQLFVTDHPKKQLLCLAWISATQRATIT
jgi:hypothetical protein